MHAWPSPSVPALTTPGPPVSLHDTASGQRAVASPAGPARLYVCGITPYDATHLGHAATYVAFDLLNRAWRNAGHDVRYVQNVTDVDDPLLERATATGVDWVTLAEQETERFRGDMVALRVLAPAHYIGAVESIPLVTDYLARLREVGSIYQVQDDWYFSVTSDPTFGDESGLSRAEMLRIFPERGGDPDREGKQDPLDALVWRAERPGEPSWPSPFGPGRPGWHIECAAIAGHYLGPAFDVQGGGSDLVFPHHEMCAAHAQVAHSGARFAQAYAHAGMVAYQGEKMSKSRGNLVFVSRLREAGVDPMAIRLVLLSHHYRADWEWVDSAVDAAAATLTRWRAALARGAGAPAAPVVQAVLGALADDLDAPRALAAVEDWASATLAGADSDAQAASSVSLVLDAALGLAL